MKENINIMICDHCGEIIEEYEYYCATMPPYRLYTCKCGRGSVIRITDELFEKYKKEVDEKVNNLIIINKEIIIRDH